MNWKKDGFRISSDKDMVDMDIRHAVDRDCPTIVSFTQRMLRDLEAVEGDPINPDEIFWDMYRENLVDFVHRVDRLYLLAQTDSGIAGFLEGKINDIVHVQGVIEFSPN